MILSKSRTRLLIQIASVLFLVPVFGQSNGPKVGPNTFSEELREQWRYHSYEEIIAHHQALGTTDIAQTEVIGHSVEGREIWAIKISDNRKIVKALVFFPGWDRK